MSEEYRWITGGIEGGGEIPPEAVTAITIVAGSITDITAVANYIHQVGDITLVDGNFQTIAIRRQNDADWLASNPILAPGEMALILDANPKVVKIGDGVTPFEELPVLFSTSSINIAELLEAVEAAKSAQTAAEAAAATAVTKADQASNAAASATASAVLAEKWAVEEGTSTLPNGEKSAKESARLAGLRAQESRLVKRRAPISASELMSSSALYRITPVRAAAPVVVTVPAQVFSSANDEEAWAIYRMEQAGGTVQFLGQTGGTGADLQSGTIKAQAKYFRKVAAVDAGQKTLTGRITIPAVTAGKLYIMALVSHGVLTALTNLCTITGGLVATAIRTLASQSAINSHSALIWEAPLTAFAGSDIDVTISSGPNLVSIGLFMWAVDGQGTTATRQNSTKVTSGANVSTTLTAVDKASLILAAAVKRGNESDIDFSSFSSNLGLQSEGGTAASGDANQTDPLKNFVYGVGVGNANVTADFVATAAWNVSSNPACIAIIVVPPKTVTGAGNTVMKYKGGVDTLNTLYGKAVLWFDPNGKDVVVDIG
jgi:hypothetical protein